MKCSKNAAPSFGDGARNRRRADDARSSSHDQVAKRSQRPRVLGDCERPRRFRGEPMQFPNWLHPVTLTATHVRVLRTRWQHCWLLRRAPSMNAHGDWKSQRSLLRSGPLGRRSWLGICACGRAGTSRTRRCGVRAGTVCEQRWRPSEEQADREADFLLHCLRRSGVIGPPALY